MSGETQAQADAKTAKYIDDFFSKLESGAFGTSTTPTDTNTSSKSVTKLTTASAKALLELAAKSAQYTGTFSSADISDFIAKFNAEQAKQIETVVKAASSKIQPGLTAEAAQKQLQSIITTEYPSYFKPETFASDFVWSKVNFKDEKSLGGKALTALGNVRAILGGFGPLDFSDIEIQTAARKIARGEISNDDFRSTIAQKAMVNYPQYAERLKQNPGSTLKDLASPYINLMAKELELDPEAIQLDDPILDKALRPDGTAGKLPTASLAEFRIALRNSPKWQYTTAANEMAREGATALARAMGGGI
jgi:gas vesicle protein